MLRGFGAGVMLAASVFWLIIPGLEAVQSGRLFGGGPWVAGGMVGTASIMGAAALMLMDHLLPHEHFIKGREGQSPGQLRRTWLFVFAIILYNLPEGLAIGVGYAGHNDPRAYALAMGYFPPGPSGRAGRCHRLARGRLSPRLAVGIGMASGLVAPVGAVLGVGVIGHSIALLPWGLGFAAGAMLFATSHEIIPESHRKGHERYATSGLIAGFVLMMLLDTALA